MERFQRFRQSTQFQIAVNGKNEELSAVVEWDDNSSIDCLSISGQEDVVSQLLSVLRVNLPAPLEYEADGIVSVAYFGANAIDVNRAVLRLNLLPLRQEKSTVFEVETDAGHRLFVNAKRCYVWVDTSHGWMGEDGPRYWSESNFPVARQDGCAFQINGETYRSRRHPLDP